VDVCEGVLLFRKGQRGGEEWGFYLVVGRKVTLRVREEIQIWRWVPEMEMRQEANWIDWEEVLTGLGLAG